MPFQNFKPEGTRFYSAETYSTLRNCRLLEEVTVDGVTFLRCLPPRTFNGQAWVTDADKSLAVAERVIAEINEPGVIRRFNERDGWYVGVPINSPIYRIICSMKS